ncbi:Hypothetical predicted protein [Mytilus galloprovincialis]|uniref:Uncharacterized protein n=1 Tax=Mytilus galloprovincialis TaxID=29158 RepID=A0A8B6DSZ4_MYTGA|nr:Hypothetical predicted protein [Mytilus galloprovincialis]
MMLTLLLVSLVASVSALNKGGPLLGGLVNGGVITSGPILGGGGIIGGSGGIVGGGGLLLKWWWLGGLIGGLNTGLVGGGQPWCTCSLKCAPGQIKLNKNCNLAPLLPGSLNTCCSLCHVGNQPKLRCFHLGSWYYWWEVSSVVLVVLLEVEVDFLVQSVVLEVQLVVL